MSNRFRRRSRAVQNERDGPECFLGFGFLVRSYVEYLPARMRRVDERYRRQGADIDELIEQVVTRSGVDDLLDRMANDQETKDQVDAICAAAEAAGLTHGEAYVFYARLRDVEYDAIAKTLGIGRESCVTYYSNALGKVRRAITGQPLYKGVGKDKEIGND